MGWNIALVALLAWGALAFGAVYPWAFWPLNVGSVTIGAVGWGASRAHRVVGPSRGLRVSLAVAVFATILQVLPFSGATLTRLSPSGDALFGMQSALGVRTALSLDPLSTTLSIVWLVALTVLFVGSVRWFESVGVRAVPRGVMVVGLVLALVGIVQTRTYAGAIYGFWEPRFGRGPFGPFVNANHFAGWMMMGLPLVVGSLLAGFGRALQGVRTDWRSRVLWLSSPEANTLLVVGLVAILMSLALVLTFSRSGITCFALAVLLSAWFVIRRKSAGARRALSLGYLTLMTLVVAGCTGLNALARTFAGSQWDDFGGRLVIWRQGLHIVADFALTGTGMNTYGSATPLYSLETSARLVHAHNDYLELAAEGGMLVGVPIVLAAGFFLRDVLRRFRSGADDETTYWIRAGAVTGLAAIALQELVDFSLQMPGNMLMFTVLCAIAVHRATDTVPLSIDRG